MREKLQQIFTGRQGMDELSKLLFWTGLAGFALALLCMAAVVWVCIEMLILHNRECSNPMPQFESHTGGEGNA